MKISSLLLFIAVVSTIDTTDAITRRLGSTHHSLALGGGSSSSLLSVDQDDNFYSLFQQQLSADSTSQRRQYSPTTSSSSSVSSDKSSTSTSTTLSPFRSKQQFPRGRGIINNNIKNINMTRFSDYLYDENEGTLYSLPSIATFSALLKIRGGGTVCVDNYEGHFYYPSTAASATASAAAPQQQQQRSHTPWQLITHLIDEQFLLHYRNHRTLFLPKLFWHHHQD